MTLDDLDQRILDALREDGRMSVTEIAQRVDSTASTVRKRMRRMEAENGLRVVATTDYYAAGFEILLAVGIEVEGRAAEAVGRELAEFPEVFCVNLTTGSCALELLVGARDHEEDALMRLVAPMLGVNDRDSAHARQRAERKA